MDSWPTDDRDREIKPERNGRRKSKKQETAPGYPQVEVGSLNSITLREEKGRLEWTSIVKQSAGQLDCCVCCTVLKVGIDGERVRPKGKAVNVFPVTRPLPLRVPRISIKHRAEQGVCNPAFL